ncbi:fungal-specific transcription factor domain-containing protein [Roridomyces roridus]|uniref:Fungal-specific transcription factor domain-containing protein n=1 Tax=Roridomyces roridus TaxID=1738132 RepID=A0AAD7B9C2_9AGAR|nr:fungal-specific transcription factor domain-containing protein [Roridomyces roridus]
MSANATKVKRRRACDMCRQRRRRCDGGEPCGHCVDHEFKCSYANSVQEFLPSDPQIEALKSRIDLTERLLHTTRQTTGPFLYFQAMRTIVEPFIPHPEDRVNIDDFADSFRSLSLEAPAGFQGKSSTAMLTKTAVAERAKGHGFTRSRSPTPSTPEGWSLQSLKTHRSYQFPEETLINSLVSLYFLHLDPILPLLERSLFEEGINRRLHEHKSDFGSTLLLVCALGSLYSTEPDRTQMAWDFFNRVELCGHSLRQQPTLYDLQSYCLAAQFLHCTANIRSCWIIVGFGIGLAQDIGAHRRKPTEPMITVEEEMEKRALWILLFFDAQLSGSLGRPTLLNPVEIHITLPSEFHPGRQTSPNLSFFICYLNLYRLENFVLRLLNTNFDLPIKGMILPHTVRQLDAMLEQWYKAIPKNLAWDPNQPHALSFDQSATLHCLYYYTLTLLHRPSASISSMRPRPLPSNPICRAAARKCIHVAQVHQSRRPNNPLLFNQNQLFDAAMLLILDMWSNDEKGDGEEDDIAYVRTAIEVLKAQQERWPAPSYYTQVLERLLSLDDRTPSSSRSRSTPASPPQFEDEDTGNMSLFPPVLVGDEEIRIQNARRWPWAAGARLRFDARNV